MMINWKPRGGKNGGIQVLFAATLVLFFVAKLISEPFSGERYNLLLSRTLPETVEDNHDMPDDKAQAKEEAPHSWNDAPLVQKDHHDTTRGSIRGPMQKKNDSGGYVPTSCEETLNDQLLDGNDKPHKDPNQGIMHGRQVIHATSARSGNPKFWVSVHNKKFDGTRWGIMEYGDYYERALSDAYAKILKDSAQGGGEMRVLDVGANIGWFGLLSASHGPNVVVDSFEPNPKNRLRFCESLQLNGWGSEYHGGTATTISPGSQVNLYPFGIGEEEEYLSFQENANPGMGRFLKPEEKAEEVTTIIRVIKLDEFAIARGWLENQNHPDIAILKVDVEGLENAVIKGAAKLIEAKIIRNIFMEVTAPEDMPQNEEEDLKQALQIIIQTGYTLHRVGGWLGPNKPFEKAPTNLGSLADAIIRRTREEGAMQLNLWWTLDVDQAVA